MPILYLIKVLVSGGRIPDIQPKPVAFGLRVEKCLEPSETAELAYETAAWFKLPAGIAGKRESQFDWLRGLGFAPGQQDRSTAEQASQETHRSHSQ
jgi:hypothetical protein